MKNRYPRTFNQVDDNWVDLANKIFEKADYVPPSPSGAHWRPETRWTENRTGVRTLDSFGGQTVHSNIQNNFPILSLKKTHWKSVVEELLWFLRGSTNVKELQEKGVSIWDEWAKPDGSVGPVYGYQWRNWNGKGIDQLKNLISTLKTDPFSRRLILSAWNPEQLPEMALPPCHCFSQFHVEKVWVSHQVTKLNLHLYQRSADLFLGVPFNVASYALLLQIIAKMVGMVPGELTTSYGSVHIYENHAEEFDKLVKDYKFLKLDPKYNRAFGYPKVILSDAIAELEDPGQILPTDIELVNYDPWPGVKADVAV